ASRTTPVACLRASARAAASTSSIVILRPLPADPIAACTIARLIRLSAHSPIGVAPVRKADTKSRSEPSIPEPGRGGDCGRGGAAPAGSVTSNDGGPSPSQAAVPYSPDSRQDAFHEVSRPGEHQLPV